MSKSPEQPIQNKRSFFKSKKFLLLLIILILLLLGFFIVTRLDRKTFEKEWKGDLDSVVGNIVITINGATVWNAPMPANHTMSWANLPNNSIAEVWWTDWRGSQHETFDIECVDGVDHETNHIPSPPLKSKW